ncbi:succinylglutamate desuccinylase [Sinomicrobium soli]|nr:succinylglutamate desuccinylase [Sinomicrobium sp. N-1-3-6]
MPVRRFPEGLHPYVITHCTILLFALFLNGVSAQENRSFIHGPEPGERLDTLLRVYDSGNTASLPVSVIRGKQKGPVFTVVAGIHGYEYPPIIAVQQLMAEIDPDRLSGTLVVIPIANTPAFYGRSVFLNPQDSKNLNRVFPGDKAGSVTEQIAYRISEEIIPVSDVFLDIHAGDANEDLLPFVCYYDKRDAPQQNELARRLTAAAGFEYNVVYPYNITPDEAAEYAFKHATQQGVPSLSIEAGKLGTVQEEAVTMTREAVYRMLHEMQMYPYSGTGEKTQQQWFGKQSYIKCPQQGIFYSKVKSGDRIAKGQYLGHITDVFGNRRADITSPADGIVLYKVGTPPVNAGETLFCIGGK